MLLIAAAALATATPQPAAPADAQATATIRVLAAVRLKLDGSANPGAPPARDALVRTTEGTRLTAKLIEFQ